MKERNLIRTKMDKVQAIVFSLVYLIIMLYLLSGCGSTQPIPSEGCCSSSEVTEDKVNLDLVKKDGVMIILPTITTDTIK